MARPAPLAASAPSGQRLSFWQKTVYGFGDTVLAVRQTVLQFALMPLYTDVVVLPAVLAGLGAMLGRVWDAVNDPLTGYLSDQTRTRLGRRRPFLLAAAVPMGLTFAVLWSPPEGMSALWGFVYMVLAYVLLDTCFTMYATPYLALGAELTDDYDERTQLSASRSFFHVLGLFAGGTIPWVLQARYADDRATGFAIMGVGVGAFMFVAALLTGLLTRERPMPAGTAARERVSFRGFLRGFRSTLANRPFRIMLATFAVLQLGGGIHQTLVPYAFQYWLGMQDLIGVVIAVYMGSFLLSLPLWTRMSRWLGKDRALKLCMLWGAVSLAALPWVFEPGMGPLRLGAMLVFAGLGNGGWTVMPIAIAADIIDADELETSQRREGAYFGVWTLVLKLATAVALGIVGTGLHVIGYVPNVEQTPATIEGIRLLYGPVPALCLLAGLAVFHRFPLTRERHAEIQAALALRRG